jgi:alkanesulfonate monooxygenase SsuD/methylene tetrahydromethanopterin reductase-like flavin-dependent oxidoreductase (luciferase family)
VVESILRVASMRRRGCMPPRLRSGLFVPNFGGFSRLDRLTTLAVEAEAAGWEGFFLWDHVHRREVVPTVDPWVALAAIAVRTERMRLGTLVTPVARRRPWKLARETTSLDHLSGGRMVLGVGLGSPAESEFAQLGEDPDARIRAQKLDEGLEVLSGLWTGKPFRYRGEHFRVEDAVFEPTPLQSPRIPIWVGGTWPAKAPFRRAARWDGVFPLKRDGPLLTPDDLREVVAFLSSERGHLRNFDVVATGVTPGESPDEAAATVEAFEAAGATWWLEWLSWRRGPFDEMRERVLQGPPVLTRR